VTRLANGLTFARNDYLLLVASAVRPGIRIPWPASRRPFPPTATIGNAIDVEGLQSAEPNGFRTSLGIGEKAPVVGVVANFRWQKGHEDLLRAADIVRRTIPDVRFVLVGRGPLEDALRRRVGDLGLGETVVFAGALDEAGRIMPAFDVFALASVQEGLAVVVLEAMAAGVPVVATAVGGIPEAVIHGESGLLVPPADPERMAAAITSVLKDRGLAARLRTGGAERARRFDIRPVVARMEAIYSELLS
jgi:glycosyltransferase involved in cell wall biosynthesis